MGYDRHHAIIITTYDLELIQEAAKRAVDFRCQCSPIMTAEINAWHTIVIPPDGSKEGWPDSTKGDAGRAKLIEWLDSKRYEDGSSPYDWIEVQYGDDNQQTLVTAHSDETDRWCKECKKND